MTNSNKDMLKIGAIGLGLIFGYSKVIVPILEALNLKQTSEEKSQDESIDKGGASGKPQSKNPWSRQYINILNTTAPAGARILLLTVSGMKSLAKTIYDSKQWYGDDEAKLYGAFRSITSHSQLSQLSGFFYTEYKKDLYEYVKSFLNTEELATVTDIVNNMKKGYIINGKVQ